MWKEKKREDTTTIGKKWKWWRNFFCLNKKPMWACFNHNNWFFDNVYPHYRCGFNHVIDVKFQLWEFQGIGIWVVFYKFFVGFLLILHNLSYGHHLNNSKDISKYNFLISKPNYLTSFIITIFYPYNYLTPFLITISYLYNYFISFLTHQYGHEKAH
jgi:hypothetical protein